MIPLRSSILFTRFWKQCFCALFLLWVPAVKFQAQTGDTLCALRGVINVSVANIHAAPDFESPMETQALLGTPVKILRKARWYQIQTPDGYISWVHREVVTPVDSLELQQWLNGPRLMVTSHHAWVYENSSSETYPVSDVVSGCVFRLTGETGSFYQVVYPDGRTGFLPKQDALLYSEWEASCSPLPGSMIETALSLKGIPYLWAGTSSKGVDCSGLLQIAAFLNGIVIPRNASQQVKMGRRVDCLQGISALETGDWVIFGRAAANGQAERVTHIGIYLGEGRFIHSQGYVRIGSLEPSASGYDAFNHNRWLGAVRVAAANGVVNAPLIREVPFYRNLY